MKLKLYSPLKDFFINQRFGENATPIYGQLGLVGHNGIDFRAVDGTPIYPLILGRSCLQPTQERQVLA